MPVSTLAWPRPSTFSSTVMSVSFVVRVTRARRPLACARAATAGRTVTPALVPPFPRPIAPSLLSAPRVCEAAAHGSRVRVVPLERRQAHHRRRQAPQPAARRRDDAGALDEIIHAERREETRRAAGWQHVIRTGH